MGDRVWVGTWRPHRPRIPIAAQYTSPGPKYSIQGTTGYMKHNPTKKKAPAYSISGTRPRCKESCSPGPRYYVASMTRRGKEVAPAYTITGRPIVKTEITPGPSDYSPEKSRKHVYQCAPIHSISFRSKSFRVDSTPGPARYTVPKMLGPNTVNKTASPCYSMKWKSNIGYFYEDRHKTPGPAAYNRPKLDAYKHRAPEYSMSSPSRPPGDKTLYPGPAAYNIGKVTLKKSMSSGITFGIRHSEYTVPLIMEIY